MLGPAFFDLGQPMLEAACASIASWYVYFRWRNTPLLASFTLMHILHSGMALFLDRAMNYLY